MPMLLHKSRKCLICKTTEALVTATNFGSVIPNLQVRDYMMELLDPAGIENLNLTEKHLVCVSCLDVINNLLYIKRHLIEIIVTNDDPTVYKFDFKSVFSTFKSNILSIRYTDSPTPGGNYQQSYHSPSVSPPSSPCNSEKRNYSTSSESSDSIENGPMLEILSSEPYKKLTEAQQQRENERFNKARRSMSVDPEVMRIFKKKKRRRGTRFTRIKGGRKSQQSFKSMSPYRENCYSRASNYSLYSCQTSFSYNAKKFFSGQDDFECHQCSDTYKSLESLTRHKTDIHHLLDNYVCDVCENVRFTTMDDLKLHRLIHHDRDKLNCLYCSKEFNSLMSYQIHTKQHLEKSYPCQYCDKIFVDDTSRWQHATKIHRHRKSPIQKLSTKILARVQNNEKLNKEREENELQQNNHVFILRMKVQTGFEDYSELLTLPLDQEVGQTVDESVPKNSVCKSFDVYNLKPCCVELESNVIEEYLKKKQLALEAAESAIKASDKSVRLASLDNVSVVPEVENEVSTDRVEVMNVSGSSSVSQSLSTAINDGITLDEITEIIIGEKSLSHGDEEVKEKHDRKSDVSKNKETKTEHLNTEKIPVLSIEKLDEQLVESLQRKDSDYQSEKNSTEYIPKENIDLKAQAASKKTNAKNKRVAQKSTKTSKEKLNEGEDTALIPKQMKEQGVDAIEVTKKPSRRIYRRNTLNTASDEINNPTRENLGQLLIEHVTGDSSHIKQSRKNISKILGKEKLSTRRKSSTKDSLEEELQMTVENKEQNLENAPMDTLKKVSKTMTDKNSSREALCSTGTDNKVLLGNNSYTNEGEKPTENLRKSKRNIHKTDEEVEHGSKTIQNFEEIRQSTNENDKIASTQKLEIPEVKISTDNVRKSNQNTRKANIAIEATETVQNEEETQDDTNADASIKNLEVPEAEKSTENVRKHKSNSLKIAGDDVESPAIPNEEKTTENSDKSSVTSKAISKDLQNEEVNRDRMASQNISKVSNIRKSQRNAKKNKEEIEIVTEYKETEGVEKNPTNLIENHKREDAVLNVQNKADEIKNKLAKFKYDHEENRNKQSETETSTKQNTTGLQENYACQESNNTLRDTSEHLKDKTDNFSSQNAIDMSENLTRLELKTTDIPKTTIRKSSRNINKNIEARNEDKSKEKQNPNAKELKKTASKIGSKEELLEKSTGEKSEQLVGGEAFEKDNKSATNIEEVKVDEIKKGEETKNVEIRKSRRNIGKNIDTSNSSAVEEILNIAKVNVNDDVPNTEITATNTMGGATVDITDDKQKDPKDKGGQKKVNSKKFQDVSVEVPQAGLGTSESHSEDLLDQVNTEESRSSNEPLKKIKGNSKKSGEYSKGIEEVEHSKIFEEVGHSKNIEEVPKNVDRGKSNILVKNQKVIVERIECNFPHTSRMNIETNFNTLASTSKEERINAACKSEKITKPKIDNKSIGKFNLHEIEGTQIEVAMKEASSVKKDAEESKGSKNKKAMEEQKELKIVLVKVDGNIKETKQEIEYLKVTRSALKSIHSSKEKMVETKSKTDGGKEKNQSVEDNLAKNSDVLNLIQNEDINTTNITREEEENNDIKLVKNKAQDNNKSAETKFSDGKNQPFCEQEKSTVKEIVENSVNPENTTHGDVATCSRENDSSNKQSKSSFNINEDDLHFFEDVPEVVHFEEVNSLDNIEEEDIIEDSFENALTSTRLQESYKHSEYNNKENVTSTHSFLQSKPTEESLEKTKDKTKGIGRAGDIKETDFVTEKSTLRSTDKSATALDKTLERIDEEKRKLNEKSAKLIEEIQKLNEEIRKPNEESTKLNEQSTKLNEESTKPNVESFSNEDIVNLNEKAAISKEDSLVLTAEPVRLKRAALLSQLFSLPLRSNRTSIKSNSIVNEDEIAKKRSFLLGELERLDKSNVVENNEGGNIALKNIQNVSLPSPSSQEERRPRKHIACDFDKFLTGSLPGDKLEKSSRKRRKSMTDDTQDDIQDAEIRVVISLGDGSETNSSRPRRLSSDDTSTNEFKEKCPKEREKPPDKEMEKPKRSKLSNSLDSFDSNALEKGENAESTLKASEKEETDTIKYKIFNSASLNRRRLNKQKLIKEYISNQGAHYKFESPTEEETTAQPLADVVLSEEVKSFEIPSSVSLLDQMKQKMQRKLSSSKQEDESSSSLSGAAAKRNFKTKAERKQNFLGKGLSLENVRTDRDLNFVSEGKDLDVRKSKVNCDEQVIEPGDKISDFQANVSKSVELPLKKSAIQVTARARRKTDAEDYSYIKELEPKDVIPQTTTSTRGRRTRRKSMFKEAPIHEETHFESNEILDKDDNIDASSEHNLNLLTEVAASRINTEESLSPTETTTNSVAGKASKRIERKNKTPRKIPQKRGRKPSAPKVIENVEETNEVALEELDNESGVQEVKKSGRKRKANVRLDDYYNDLQPKSDVESSSRLNKSEEKCQPTINVPKPRGRKPKVALSDINRLSGGGSSFLPTTCPDSSCTSTTSVDISDVNNVNTCSETKDDLLNRSPSVCLVQIPIANIPNFKPSKKHVTSSSIKKQKQ